MPFSMIAVILLILAGAGTALMYGTEESKSNRRLDLAQLREMQSYAMLESSELDQLASDVASKALWSVELKNESDL